MESIYNKHDTDKNSYFYNYTRQYKTLLNKFRNKPIKYLEIGVYKCGSLYAFKETFKEASCVLGLDINIECKNGEKIDDNIFIEIGDATNETFIKNITDKHGTFDIILDDGSHMNSDVIKSFELLFPLLNDDGIYIVKDTVCYKSHLVDNYPNHLEYFWNYTKYLNQTRADGDISINSEIGNHCMDPYKIIKKTNNVFEYSIDKIEFGCSYIAIYKKIRKHWINE